MRTLNRRAGEMVVEFSAQHGDAVHSVTDITGFGLVGHAREMALGSNVTIELDHTRVEPLPGALDAVRAGCVPGGLKNNIEFASCAVSLATGVPPEFETLLYDPQTSGGLLISLDAAQAPALESALRAAGVPVSIMGRVIGRGEHAILVK
jgi:selenide,water dikinase